MARPREKLRQGGICRKVERPALPSTHLLSLPTGALHGTRPGAASPFDFPRITPNLHFYVISPGF